MIGIQIRPTLLFRDNKLFLQLTSEEAEVWITRVFERIRPQMPMISGILLQEQFNIPLNLEVVLMVASHSVREVAVEMAGTLLTRERQQRLAPALNAYCDELLAQDRTLDAAYIQQGLIGIEAGQEAGKNPLLVEICLRSIYHQVALINGNAGQEQRSQ